VLHRSDQATLPDSGAWPDLDTGASKLRADLNSGADLDSGADLGAGPVWMQGLI